MLLYNWRMLPMSPGNGSAISELDETHDMGWEDDASRWESDADGDSGYEEELEEDQPADESTLSDSSADAAAAGWAAAGDPVAAELAAKTVADAETGIAVGLTILPHSSGISAWAGALSAVVATRRRHARSSVRATSSPNQISRRCDRHRLGGDVAGAALLAQQRAADSGRDTPTGGASGRSSEPNGPRTLSRGHGDDIGTRERRRRSSSSASAASGGERPSLRHMRRVVPMHRFVCFEEEDWFVRLHVTLAAEAGRVFAAARRCFGARDTNEQVRALQALESSIETLVKVHYAAGIGQPPGADAPPVTPSVLMGRLHRFLPPTPPEMNDCGDAEVMGARIYCASGIDQAVVLHLIGARRGAHALQRFRDAQQATGGDLPVAHRRFLEDVLRRTPMRERVDAAVGGERLAVQELARLELAHNSCIDMALRLFTRRHELVRATLGVDALAGAWQQERVLIQEARLRLLVERREMEGPRRGLPTRAHAYKREPSERGR